MDKRVTATIAILAVVVIFFAGMMYYDSEKQNQEQERKETAEIVVMLPGYSDMIVYVDDVEMKRWDRNVPVYTILKVKTLVEKEVEIKLTKLDGSPIDSGKIKIKPEYQFGVSFIKQI